VRQCSFRGAVEFLAALAGVEYRPDKLSAAEIQRAQQTRERAEREAWRVHDEIIRVRGYYGDCLRRAERLEASTTDWDMLTRLARVSTFFFAAYTHTNRLDSGALARFALMTPAMRRAAILEGTNVAP
jgi:hypothetical protein